MKYKGFEIVADYFVGSDFTIDKHGKVKDRKPTSKDIACYIIYDPVENGKRWIAENTIKECKETIDSFLSRNGLKRNS